MILWTQEPELNWCKLEAKSCSTSLSALLTSKLPVHPSQFTCNPIVISTLNIWFQFRFTYGLQGLFKHSLIHNNHLFPPPSTDAAFSLWQRSGLVKLKDLYTNNVFASFSDLCEQFNLPKSHLFRYFQIRNFVKSNSTFSPNISPNSVIDSILDITTNQKGLISRRYTLISHLKATSLDKIRKDWEEELGRAIDDSSWDSALICINNSTSCSKLNLIQFKVVHRIYLTNSKLSKMYPDIADTCNRCHMRPANMTQRLVLSSSARLLGPVFRKHRKPKWFVKFVVRPSDSFHPISRKHRCVTTVVKTLVANERFRGTRSTLRASLTLHKTSNTTECPAGDAKVTIGYIA